MPPKKDLAEQKIKTALAKLYTWKNKLEKNGVHDWQVMGKALHLTHLAINTSPKYYKGWILLADIYVQIGKIYLAKKSLEKAYSLVNIRPDFPGRYYRKIERKLKVHEKTTVAKKQELLIPDWFQKKYGNYFYDSE